MSLSNKDLHRDLPGHVLHPLLLGPGAGVPGRLVEAEVEAGQLDVAPGSGDQLQPVAGDGFGPGALDVGPKRASVKHVS